VSTRGQLRPLTRYTACPRSTTTPNPIALQSYAMFGSPSTPTIGIYNGLVDKSTPLSLPNHHKLTQPPQTPVPSSYQNNSEQQQNHQSYNHPTLSPSLSSSPTGFDTLCTPIIHPSHVQPGSNYNDRSPVVQMSPYPGTPSPRSGVSGGMIISDVRMM
jgi:hypothetical protein